MTPEHLPERIQSKIVFKELHDCWEWTGCDSGNGYGKVSFKGRMKMAHRLVYELLVGPVPVGMVLDHLCRNRACVNPHHLEPVTIKVNTHRGEAALFARKRYPSDDYDDHAKAIRNMWPPRAENVTRALLQGIALDEYLNGLEQ